jgi:5-methyltetrahydropteroyltriglutamate--homocysteine methyltransferase
MNTLLPTSTAGSLPKPSWLAQPEKLWSPWRLQGAELTAGKQDALRLSLADQQRASISSRPSSSTSTASTSKSVKLCA